MVGVVKLGGDPDLLSGNTRVLDTLSNLSLVSVGSGSVCEDKSKTLANV